MPTEGILAGMVLPSPLPSRVAVSQHAVDRYRARWARGLDEAAARTRLDEALARARLVRSYPDGDQLWRGPRPQSLRLIVSFSRGVATLVTVLPPYGEESDPPDARPVGLLALPDWTDVPGQPGLRARHACRICRVPVVPSARDQSTCGASACRTDYRAQVRAWQKEHDPASWSRRLAQLREGGSRYLDRHNEERNARRRAAVPAPSPAPRSAVVDPWALPSPPVGGAHLPGAWRELVFQPPPHTPIPQTHASSLHGVVSRAVGQGHSRQRADFVLTQAPVPSGWGVFFVEGATARRVSCAPMPGLHLDGRPWGICFGPGVVVPRRPAPVPPGRYAVEVTTLAPVCIRRSVEGKTLVRLGPTAASLRASLTGAEFLGRCGLLADGDAVPPASVALVLVEGDTRRESVEVGGHWNAGDDQGHGHVVGWTGTVWLETNAVGLWLLRHAEIVGLGGRVAAGFGQVRVRQVTA